MSNSKHPEKAVIIDEFYRLQVTDLNHNGEGVGKVDGFTLFIPGALPGERVSVKVNKLHRNYGEATLTAIEDRSDDRIAPICSYFPVCGGCQLQHLKYSGQLSWKKSMLAETLRRLAGINVQIEPVIGMSNPWHFRNKARVHFNLDRGKLDVGFYASSSRQVIDIKKCPVQHPANEILINALRRALKSFIKKYNISSFSDLPVRDAAIRTSFAEGKTVIAFEAAAGRTYINRLKELAELLLSEAEELLHGVVLLPAGNKNKGLTVLAGSAELTETLATLQYKLAPRAFFQVNPRQAEKLYEIAADLAGNAKSAFDLYCGTGTFTLYLSSKASKVIGTDSTEEAIINARENARLNNIENVCFHHLKAEEAGELIRKAENPSLICLNPPRSGCSDKLLHNLVEIAPEKILYISCNPATLARDLSILAGSAYQLDKVQPLDMFPHTTHVECVVLISKE